MVEVGRSRRGLVAVLLGLRLVGVQKGAVVESGKAARGWGDRALLERGVKAILMVGPRQEGGWGQMEEVVVWGVVQVVWLEEERAVVLEGRASGKNQRAATKIALFRQRYLNSKALES